MSEAVIHRLTVYRLRLPAEGCASGRSSESNARESVVVQAETARGVTGWGEARVRPGWIGESADSVIRAIESVYLPRIVEFHPASFPEALEAIEALPWDNGEDRPCYTARAAVELAMVDGALRVFDRDVDALVRWMGLPGFGSPGSRERVRVIGAITDRNTTAALKQVKRLYWQGVRDFKVSVGFEGDIDLVQVVAAYLEKSIEAKKATLRVDAQGAWTKDQAIEWFSDTSSYPLAAIEQPLPRGSEDDLLILADLFEVPLAHDESLVTMADAHRLKSLGVAHLFEMEADKCGGLIASLRMAAYARREGVRLSYGSACGATGILPAVKSRFLQVCPGVEWAQDDAIGRGSFVATLRGTLSYVLGRKAKGLDHAGLGVEINPKQFTNRNVIESTVYNL